MPGQGFQLGRVDAVERAKVDAVFIGVRTALVMGIDAASLAEVMLGRSCAPGVKRQVVRATDDHGLRSVEVRYKRNTEGTERPLRIWGAEEIGARTDTALVHEWSLEKGSFEPGDVVTYRAVARDRMPGRQSTSDQWQIRVVDPVEKAERTASALEAIMKGVEQTNKATELFEAALKLCD